MPPPQSEFYRQERMRRSLEQDEDDDYYKKAEILWDFNGRGNDELSVPAGSYVLVLQEYGYKPEEKDWFKVKRLDTKQTGYVPSNVVKILTAQEIAQKTTDNTVSILNWLI